MAYCDLHTARLIAIGEHVGVSRRLIAYAKVENHQVLTMADWLFYKPTLLVMN